MIKRKLIIESPQYDLDFETLQESADGEKRLYITGRYIMLDEKNKNGRIYGSDEMIPALETFQREFIDQNRAGGELNHSDSCDMDLSKLCHKIVSLKPESPGSNFWVGKSKVLTTPSGKILESLCNDGYNFGVSTKSLGTLEESTDGNRVRSPILVGVDAVFDPSVSSAFVNGILENKEFIIDYADGKYQEATEDFEEKLEKLPRHSDEKNALYLEAVSEFLKLLRG